jgi:hypothetical protein
MNKHDEWLDIWARFHKWTVQLDADGAYAFWDDICWLRDRSSGPESELAKCRDLLRRANNELLPAHESDGWPPEVVRSAEQLMDEMSEYLARAFDCSSATEEKGR